MQRRRDFLGALLVAGFDVADGVGAGVDVVDYPCRHLVPAMLDPSSRGELHHFPARRGHGFEPVVERHNGEAQGGEVLAHLHRALSVVRNLLDVVADAEVIDKVFSDFTSMKICVFTSPPQNCENAAPDTSRRDRKALYPE